MTVNKTDFDKIWASTSSVPEYTFSDTDYKNGWEFVGNLPPTRAMWDALQRRNDEKTKYVADATDGVVNVSQFGAKGDGVTDDADSIQNAILTHGIVRFPANKTFNVGSSIYVQGNTTIDLNGSTILLNNYVFANCKNGEDSLLYNGHGNITIKNGTIVNGEILLAHGQNIKILNLQMKNSPGHFLQIMSCKDVLIQDCSFVGMADTAGSTDAINLDPCVYSAFNVYGDGSPSYDGTNNCFITIDRCTSQTGTDAGYSTKKVMLGLSHYHIDNTYYHEYVTVQNCTIYADDSSIAGMKLSDIHYGNISNNRFIGGSTPITTAYGLCNSIVNNYRIASSSFSNPKTVSLFSNTEESQLTVLGNADTVSLYIPIGVTMSDTVNTTFKQTDPIRLTGNINIAQNKDITLSMPFTLFNRMRLHLGAVASGTFETDVEFGSFTNTNFVAGNTYSSLNGDIKITCDADNPLIIRCNSTLSTRRVFGWVDPYI